MNYEEMKAQFEDGSTPSQPGKKPNSMCGHTREELRAHQRTRTPLDSIIRMIPFALIFIGALAGGTWYLQDPEAAHNQFNQLMGNVVQGIDDESGEESANKDLGQEPNDSASSTKQELTQN